MMASGARMYKACSLDNRNIQLIGTGAKPEKPKSRQLNNVQYCSSETIVVRKFMLYSRVLLVLITMHVKNLTPVILTLTSESAFRFQKSTFRFRKFVITPIPIEVYL